VITSLADAVAGLGLQLTGRQIDQLARFRDLLAVSANEFNLTSLRDPESIERRHITESLAFGALLQAHGLLHPAGPPQHGALEPGRSVEGRELLPVAARMLDIGTGAGLPGIPIKVAWPHLHLTLLESVGKKCRFLELACDALGLAGVEVVEARAEDFGRDPARRERYDLAVARAVAPLPVLLEYALPALRVGGWLAAPKGSAAPSELEAATHAIEVLGGRLRDAAPFRPPHGARQTVVLVEKIAPAPERYPRRPGIPSKRPL
jgi:16S rRNA (guanine527-N7)-methyltransferase